MDKFECLKTMLLGNIYFLKYLNNVFNGYPIGDDLLKNPEYLKANKLSMCNLILLATKEDIIGDDGKNVVLDKDIKTAVDEIRNKTSKLTNPVLNTDEEIISFIRNKMGHGEYLPNFKSNRVIINPDSEELSINLNAYTNFSFLLSKAYLSLVHGSIYEKEFYNVRVGANESLKSENDIVALMNNFKVIKISLKNKDGNKIEESVLKILQGYLANYKQNEDEKYLEEAKNINTKYPSYEYSYSIKPFTFSKKEKREFAHNFVTSLKPGNYSNEDIAQLLGYALTCRFKNNTFNMIASAQTGIILSDVIKKVQSLDADKISERILNDYGNGIIINENVFASEMIATFESSFGYTKDTIFKDEDYSIYDFSLVNPRVMDKGSSINNINEQIAFINNEITKTKNCINNLIKNKSLAIQHDNPTTKIDNRIKECDKTIELLNQQVTDLNNRLNNINKHDFNKGVIDGIRNAISHNGVSVVESDALSTCRIIFKDVYEGKTTFECELSFQEFYGLLEKNTIILGELCDDYSLKKTN